MRDKRSRSPLPMVQLLIIALAVLALSGCAHRTTINLEGPYWKDDDNKAIPEPSYEEPPLTWTIVKRTATDQLLELLDLDRNVRKIAGNPTQAKNTNCFDEVPNSSWFTNRHGHPATHLTPAQIGSGPALTPGPDTSGIWEVYRPKVGGATPGFWIEDSRGDQYIIKFDPVDNPEMATAAAAMGSRYFYAAGYNTPQEVIVYWRPENLRIRKGATIKGSGGVKRPLTMDDITAILKQANKEPDGTIRSLASLNIGNVKGPFMYTGRRKDDPNDWCPHEHRRELRGLYVIGSLVNHYDMKDHNSMDVYVGEDGEGYLKHYLMDFGSTFGSDGNKPKPPIKGYANMFDLRDVGVSTLTLGLKSWGWENHKPYQYPSVGYFESEIFHPAKFDPISPNSAFEQMTLQDAYWGAKVVMAFSEEDLRAIVEAGQFTNREAADFLLKTLMERREKIGRYWFDKINPLDYPTMTQETDLTTLTFDDLAVTYGLEPPTAAYSYEIRTEKRVVLGPEQTDTRSLSIPDTVWEDGSDLLEIRVRTKREDSDWSHPTIFHLYRNPESIRVSIVGIEHPA